MKYIPRKTDIAFRSNCASTSVTNKNRLEKRRNNVYSGPDLVHRYVLASLCIFETCPIKFWFIGFMRRYLKIDNNARTCLCTQFCSKWRFSQNWRKNFYFEPNQMFGYIILVNEYLTGKSKLIKLTSTVHNTDKLSLCTRSDLKWTFFLRFSKWLHTSEERFSNLWKFISIANNKWWIFAEFYLSFFYEFLKSAAVGFVSDIINPFTILGNKVYSVDFSM